MAPSVMRILDTHNKAVTLMGNQLPAVVTVEEAIVEVPVAAAVPAKRTRARKNAAEVSAPLEEKSSSSITI
jgi:hypothetical protein